MGRPTTYSSEAADAVLTLMESGQSVREICRDEAMPHESTFRRWVREDRDGLAAKYERSREAQLAGWADEMQEIADDSRNDWIERKRLDGSTETVLDREHLERSRLRIDTRKWLLVKLLPKKYGDKQQLEHSGALSLEQLVAQSFTKKEAP